MSRKQVGAFDDGVNILTSQAVILEDAAENDPISDFCARWKAKAKACRLAARLLRVAGREPLSVEKIIRIVGQAHALSRKSK